jgi:hypothetical protein
MTCRKVAQQTTHFPAVLCPGVFEELGAVLQLLHSVYRNFEELGAVLQLLHSVYRNGKWHVWSGAVFPAVVFRSGTPGKDEPAAQPQVQVSVGKASGVCSTAACVASILKLAYVCQPAIICSSRNGVSADSGCIVGIGGNAPFQGNIKGFKPHSNTMQQPAATSCSGSSAWHHQQRLNDCL